MESSGSGQDPMAGSYEHNNTSSGPIKGGEYQSLQTHAYNLTNNIRLHELTRLIT
jgi:hypothetical protein